MKKHGSNFILVLMLLVGLSLLLYPSFADYWNSFTQSRAIASYSAQVSQLDETSYDTIWQQVTDHNEALINRENSFVLTDDQEITYKSLLNISGTGIMGYVEIPAIDVSLPVYHGTDEAILQVAIGHLPWTSLPCGGESTHCVISGHRGLPSARLFTDLDKLQSGDIFHFHILDRILTYEIDQIRIVEPTQVDDLLIQDGKDLATLVTCTPYGINSHRLLVRGHRVDTPEDAPVIRVTADAVVVEKTVVIPFILAPIVLLMLIGTLFPKKKT